LAFLLFPWIGQLEGSWRTIRGEAEAGSPAKSADMGLDARLHERLEIVVGLGADAR
jgi:hypothetical protein